MEPAGPHSGCRDCLHPGESRAQDRHPQGLAGPGELPRGGGGLGYCSGSVHLCPPDSIVPRARHVPPLLTGLVISGGDGDSLVTNGPQRPLSRTRATPPDGVQNPSDGVQNTPDGAWRADIDSHFDTKARERKGEGWQLAGLQATFGVG